MSIRRVFGIVVAIALVALVVVLLVRSAPKSTSRENLPYEEWLRTIARPMLIHKLSPGLVRLMTCIELEDTECICSSSLMADRSEMATEVDQYKRRVPLGLGTVHSALEDAVTKYQNLRQSVKSYCDRGASVSGIGALDSEVQKATKARDKATDKLSPYER